MEKERVGLRPKEGKGKPDEHAQAKEPRWTNRGRNLKPQLTSRWKGDEMTMASNLVRISQAKGLPLKRSTLYKWVHLNKHPELFVKLGGAVFVDLNVFDEFIEKGRLG